MIQPDSPFPYSPRSLANIRSVADSFRDKYLPTDKIPTDIDLVIEKAGIFIIPVPDMKRRCGKDACVSADLEEIFVSYDPTRRSGQPDLRTNFTLAHELGHIVMHADYFRAFAASLGQHSDAVAWAKAVLSQGTTITASRIEWEADEFAGRILVPPRLLQAEYDRLLTRLNTDTPRLLSVGNDDVVRGYLAPHLNRKFAVSTQVIECRLRLEGIFPPSR